MIDITPDGFSRRASLAGTRRASLDALAGAGATGGEPVPAGAIRGDRRGGKRCRRQIDPCRSLLRVVCDAFPTNVEVCQARLVPCCSPPARCQAGLMLHCVVDTIRDLPTP
jgi:hypothetical protein